MPIQVWATEEKHPYINYLLSCSFCLSFWSAIVVLMLPFIVVVTMSLAYSAFTVYSAIDKYVPCDDCGLKDDHKLVGTDGVLYRMEDK